MLTKDDLVQIRKVIREEVEAESENIRNELRMEIKLARMELSLRMDKLEDRLKNVEIKLTSMDKEIKNLSTQLRKPERISVQ